MFQPDLLQGQKILITGGGTGLGAEIAARYASLGAALVLCGRRESVLSDTADGLRNKHNDLAVTTRVCDIRDPVAVDEMLDSIWADEPLTGLVNNAAANFIAQTEHLSPRAIDAVLATTLHGTIYCTTGVGRRWISKGDGGSVLSILSTSVRTGRPFTVPSAIAKSGVQTMTKSLAVEWGGKNIRLVAIAPGPFPTPGADRQLMPQGRSRPASQLNPMGRVGEHQELTGLAAYLMSKNAAYINGETIAIDGGAHLRTSGAEDLLQWDDAQWQRHRAARR